MDKRSKISNLIISSFAMLILMFDGKTALEGAVEGVKLCTASVIPSLFPFITFGYVLNSALTTLKPKPIRQLCRICGVPLGGEGLLLLGFLGGYPVGAQSINDAYKNKVIESSVARKMLAFCSNAGPAFIFGIGSTMFQRRSILWALWFVHIISALIVSFLLRNKSTLRESQYKIRQITIPEALNKGIYTTATICGWVILFRILITVCKKNFLRYLPLTTQIALSGVLELTNGFHLLNQLPVTGTRFVFASCFLSLGGVCVAMQTLSVTKDIGMGLYFPGKITQCSLSFFLSAALNYILLPASERTSIPSYVWFLFLTTLVAGILLLKNEKRVDLHCKVLYNTKNKNHWRQQYAFSKKALPLLPLLYTRHKAE